MTTMLQVKPLKQNGSRMFQVLTVACLGKNEVLNSQSSSGGEPVNYKDKKAKGIAI